MIHSHLQFIMRELLLDLSSSRKHKKWAHNPLLNLSVHTKVHQNGKCECACLVQYITLLFGVLPIWKGNSVNPANSGNLVRPTGPPVSC